MEPYDPCVQGAWNREFATNEKVTVLAEALPDAPGLVGQDGTFDFVLCQNVLEHIEDDAASMSAMARALKPGGRLHLLVPANPRLYGPLDKAYEHFRRYTKPLVRERVLDAGFELDDLYSFNALGIPGWWVQNRRGTDAELSSNSLKAYEMLLRAWKPVERRWRPPIGLSVIARARKPPVRNAAPQRSGIRPAFAPLASRRRQSTSCPRGGRVPDSERALRRSGGRQQGPCRDLRLDVEAARSQFERAEDVRPHHLVAGHDVAQVTVEEQVGDQRHAFVAHHVPEAEGRMGFEPARAEDDVSLAVEDRLEQPGDVRRVVLEVGIHDCRVGAARVLEGRLHGGALSAVALMGDQLDLAVVRSLAKELEGAVGGAVVDDDDLRLLDRLVDSENPVERRLHRGLLVEYGHQDRKVGGIGRVAYPLGCRPEWRADKWPSNWRPSSTASS